MTNNCPHCGTDIRPGARFCGICGKSLHEEPAARSGSANCPHCGMPLKTDAKFCPHCGMSIPAAGSGIETTESLTRPKVEQPAGPPTSRVPQTVTTSRESRSPNRLVVGLIIILFAILLVVFGYLAWDNDWFGISGADTPTATGMMTDTATPSPTLETEVVLTPSLTTTPAPTQTELPSKTPGPVIIVEEEFEGELRDNWNVWGIPEPRIVSGFTRYLELDAPPGDAGVTTIEQFDLREVEVHYEAALLADAPNNLLSLDWDPVELTRKPGDPPGFLHLDLGNGRLLLTVSAQTICDLRLPEAVAQTVVISTGIDTISLTINEETICPPTTVDFITGDGRLSISGGGRVDGVLIMQR